MIELYQAYTDYNGMMELCESLVSHAAVKATGGTKVDYQGTELEFAAPWKRLTMVEAVKTLRRPRLRVGARTDEEARELAEGARPRRGAQEEARGLQPRATS